MTTFTDASDSDDGYELSDAEVDSVLKGHRPLDSAPGLERLADAMNALTSPPERGELSGYSQAMATYGRAFAQPRSRRVAMISSVAGLRTLASAAGAAVALGGVATIVLASGAMGPTHQAVVTPVATTGTTKTPPQADKTGTPVGPDASGPAAFGLCNAWANHQAKDNDLPGSSVAFRNLAKAAGGEARIASYCAKVPHPGSSNATKTPKATSTSTPPKRGKAPGTPPGKAKNNGTGTTRTPGPTTTTPPGTTLTTPGPATTLPTGTS